MGPSPIPVGRKQRTLGLGTWSWGRGSQVSDEKEPLILGRAGSEGPKPLDSVGRHWAFEKGCLSGGRTYKRKTQCEQWPILLGGDRLRMKGTAGGEAGKLRMWKARPRRSHFDMMPMGSHGGLK